MRVSRTAFVTGATRGIGRAIALKLADDGMNIVINYRNEEAALKLEEELLKKGVEVLKLKGDVSSYDDCESMFNEIKDKFGSLEVLVNNAGITKDNLTLRLSEEDFKDVIDVNLNGSFYCMKFAAKLMLKARYGRIISMSSIVGLHGNAGQINYAASKAGVIGMTKSLALELGKRNITVNAVAPGFIETEMTDKLSEDVKEEMLNKIPMHKYGKVEDVADLISFLSSDRANYITGQVISVDGGMNI
nr:3-oxoacyl-[acyl-carrier-protein] reductase [Anaerosphaera aminiphila]